MGAHHKSFIQEREKTRNHIGKTIKVSESREKKSQLYCIEYYPQRALLSWEGIGVASQLWRQRAYGVEPHVLMRGGNWKKHRAWSKQAAQLFKLFLSFVAWIRMHRHIERLGIVLRLLQTTTEKERLTKSTFKIWKKKKFKADQRKKRKIMT